jgi:hypothetical protein
MKKLKLIPIALIALSISFITSCRKKGCSDLDADNYDSQAEKSGTCYFRYGNKVVIIAPNSINYDPLDAPDLFIKFAKNSSPQWDYTTTVIDNSYSFTANFNAEYMFTNEQWDYEVYDQDTFDADDLVCSGSFNPLKDGTDGKIIIFNGGVEIQFPYTAKI